MGCHMKKFHIVSYLMILLTLSSCHNTGSSSTADNSSNSHNSKNLLKSQYKPVESGAVEAVSFNFIPNKSQGSMNNVGGVVYKNGIPLAVNPTSGQLTTTQAFNVSPVAVDNMLFLTNTDGINYAKMGYLVPGSTMPFDGWDSIDVTDLQARNQSQITVLSPMVWGSQQLANNQIKNTLYIVTNGADSYPHVFAWSDNGSGAFITPSFVLLDDNNSGVDSAHYQQNLQYNTAPLAVAEPSVITGKVTYVYTAAGSSSTMLGDKLLAMRIPDGSSPPYTLMDTTVFSYFGVNIGSRKIIALNVVNDVLFMELSDGTLYYSDTLIPDRINFKQLSSSSSQANQPFPLCHVDDNSPYAFAGIPANNIQSSQMIAIPGPTLTGVYLCGGTSVYMVSKNSSDLDNYKVQQLPIPQPNGVMYLTNIAATIGQLFAVVEDTDLQRYNVLYMQNPGLGTTNTWYSSITSSNGYHNNYPVDSTNPITSLGVNGGSYLFANIMTGDQKDLLLANSLVQPNDQWFSVGSDFTLPAENSDNELYIAYTDYSQNQYDGPDLTQSQPGFITATDGTNWWWYHQNWYGSFTDAKTWKKVAYPDPIIYPDGDINDGPLQLVQNYYFMFLLTKNGYILYHEADIAQLQGGWGVMYDPTKYIGGQSAGLAKKIATVPYVGVLPGDRSKAGGGWLYFRTEDSNGIGHMLFGGYYQHVWGDEHIAGTGVDYLDSTQKDVNFMDFTVTNTDQNYNNLAHTAITALDDKGNIYQMNWGVGTDGSWKITQSGLSPTNSTNNSLYTTCATPTIGDSPSTKNMVLAFYPINRYYPITSSVMNDYVTFTIPFYYEIGGIRTNAPINVLDDTSEPVSSGTSLVATRLLSAYLHESDATEPQDILLYVTQNVNHPLSFVIGSIELTTLMHSLEEHAPNISQNFFVSGLFFAQLVRGVFDLDRYHRNPDAFIESLMSESVRDLLLPEDYNNLVAAIRQFINEVLSMIEETVVKSPRPPEPPAPGSAGTQCIFNVNPVTVSA